MSSMEKLINNYKTYVQIPSILGGRIRSNGIISSTWSQRNLEKGKSSKFMKEFFLKDLERVGDTVPLDISNEVLSSYSKSGTFRAVIRESESKTFLEVWHANHVLRTVDLGALDLHGPVYADADMSSFEWSPDETKILYVAEKKAPKSEPFYKRKPATEHSDTHGDGDKDKEEKSVGEEYVFSQDWGEQMVGKKESVIAEYHVDTDTVELVKGIPKNIFVGQPTYSPDGSSIIGVAYDLEPRKLGLLYCSRPSTIFWIDAEGKYSTLNLPEKSVKSPLLSPDGSSLFWLQRKSGGTHAACMSLVKAYLPLTENSPVHTVIDVVDTELKIKSGHQFYGLYNQSFRRRPWASGARLLLSTQQKYTVNSYVVNVENGDMHQLEYPDGSLIILDVADDVVLAVHRNYLKMDKLVIGKLKDDNRITWTDVTTSHVINGFDGCMYKYLDLTASGRDPFKNFNAIYVGPKEGSDKSVPLIVWAHGGPHTAFANYLTLELLMFVSAGFAVLMVNYRGSLGSGQKSVEFTPGKIGVADVKDCISATDSALSEFSWLNPDALALVGGSHGGFLVLHLSGQYPDKYKAVVARNPVVDVASMSTTCDIPDWCYVETGKEYTQVGEVDTKHFSAMLEISPIVHAHKVKAPTLLQIGSKDLRVPPYQGTDYYLRLKANGVTTKMNLYDDCHPISSVPNEMDNIMNTVLWIEKYISH